MNRTRKQVNAVAAWLIEQFGLSLADAAQRAGELLDIAGYGPVETTCRECTAELVGPVCPHCHPEIFGPRSP